MRKVPDGSRESYIPEAGHWWLLEGSHNPDAPCSVSLDCISRCLCLGDSIPTIEDRENVDHCEVVVQSQDLEPLAEGGDEGSKGS